MAGNDPYGVSPGTKPVGKRGGGIVDFFSNLTKPTPQPTFQQMSDPYGVGGRRPAPAATSASVNDLRYEQNQAIRGYGGIQPSPVPQPNPGGQRAALVDQAAPQRSAGRPAPARPATPAAPVAPSTTTLAMAPAPAATTASAYKPVEDLGAARRAAFMGAADTATGMNEVRKLLAAEAGIADADRNKYKVSQLEEMALKRRAGTNWAASMNPRVAEAFTAKPGDPMDFTNPKLEGIAQKAGVNVDAGKMMQVDWNPQVAMGIGDGSFGRDFAVPASGAPLTRDVAVSPESADAWMGDFTRQLMREEVTSGNFKMPMNLLDKPLVIGSKSTMATDPSATIAAFQQAGERAPIDIKTAAMLAATDGGLIGGKRSRKVANLGFLDPAKLAPLQTAFRPAVAGAPR